MLQIRSARPVDVPGIAAVHQDAFSDKVQAIFGDQREKVHKLLEVMVQGPVERGYSGILVAEREGRVVGTLSIEPIYYTARERRAIENVALNELGVVRMLRASFLLWLLSHPSEPPDALIGNLAVATDSQGEGIAGRLLEQAEVWAREHGRARLALWVAASNTRAIHVYERAGFVTRQKKGGLMARLAFGVDRWCFMVKPLHETHALVTEPPASRA